MKKSLQIIKFLKRIIINSSGNDGYNVFNNTHFRKFKYIYMGLGIWPEQSIFQKLAILLIYGIISVFFFSQEVFILYYNKR